MFNKRRIAIYYLNNLCAIHERIDFDSKDFIKKLIATGFISANEVDDDIKEYYNTKLKGTPYIEKLVKEGFIHKSGIERYKI